MRWITEAWRGPGAGKMTSVTRAPGPGATVDAPQEGTVRTIIIIIVVVLAVIGLLALLRGRRP